MKRKDIPKNPISAIEITKINHVKYKYPILNIGFSIDNESKL